MNIAKRYNIWWDGLSVRAKRIWTDVSDIASMGLIFAFFAFIFTGCGDIEPRYDKAIITLADNQVVEVKVKEVWYADSRFANITAADGTKYRVHYMNVSFVKEP